MQSRVRNLVPIIISLVPIYYIMCNQPTAKACCFAALNNNKQENK